MAELMVHESHKPESDEERMLHGMTYCEVCCRLLATDRWGVRARGAAPCEGPRSLVLRGDGQLVVEAVDHG